MSYREVVHSDQAPAPIGPYSQAIRTQGEMLFVSGQIPMNIRGEIVSHEISAQTRRVLDNLRAILEAGGYDMSQVAKTTVYLHDMNDFKAMNDVYAEYFNESKPARATIQVSRLPKDVRVEIEAIAVR